MNEIIKIEGREIGGQQKQSVNARDLHAYLEVGRDFSAWIRGRIEQYEFRDGEDFLSYESTPRNGGAGNRGSRIEYALSLDMAKELSMVERNSKGKKARQYFIECERRALAPAPELSRLDILKLALDSEERAIAAESALAIAAPKVEFVDRYVESTGNKGFREVAKLLDANEARFREFLLAKGVMYRLAGSLTPMAQHLDAGRFVVKAGASEETGHAFTQAKFTSKGIAWIAGLWMEWKLEQDDGE